ncbi:nucleoside triphosphate pyrophosphohydrolase [Vannielia sp.]|uniref:nucleoside triphosphate pyrophosphohydrolase n=1 Tax=Vannielia sp. TaxID=2813045 RepID=UPI00261C474D|nr:nucleoside triphosphate pyrophosphohydrolase [Vannielia sp.]MDF1873758.1 nucleoside triphosphate pyrophosphohydrolase [Vannielia sp.]
MADPTAALIFDRDTGAEGQMQRLLAIMACLRDPDKGCPWDIEQTYATIAPYTIEEAYEVADAVEREAWGELEGELGDLLLQTVYFAQMGAEDGRFDFASIARAIADKMVSRHPHVFGPESRDKSAAQQTRDWEVQKAAERKAKGEHRTLDGVAMGLPALSRALKLQNRAARVGFDWDDVSAVLAKVQEEAAEFAEAEGNADAMEDEMGDLLFVLTNLARHKGIDPEAALRRTNAKFTRRFNAIEDALKAEGRTPTEATLDEMDALWTRIKQAEKP